ncbi:hypothetical protein [Deinococcus sp.]|uniref:hypothetical protein n=1 Tax=Deinococcus sp. TaxID=47478 RepID=UPI0025FFADBD|nr:hypothetical protein [Deinococcus sp.]
MSKRLPKLLIWSLVTLLPIAHAQADADRRVYYGHHCRSGREVKFTDMDAQTLYLKYRQSTLAFKLVGQTPQLSRLRSGPWTWQLRTSDCSGKLFFGGKLLEYCGLCR